jgi:hypothetical protein
MIQKRPLIKREKGREREFFLKKKRLKTAKEL